MDWSKITMIAALVAVAVEFVFTIVTTIFGGFDLVYLLRQLHAKAVDEKDSGQVFDEKK
jgi:hypothetical protein